MRKTTSSYDESVDSRDPIDDSDPPETLVPRVAKALAAKALTAEEGDDECGEPISSPSVVALLHSRLCAPSRRTPVPARRRRAGDRTRVVEWARTMGGGSDMRQMEGCEDARRRGGADGSMVREEQLGSYRDTDRICDRGISRVSLKISEPQKAK